MPSRPSGLSKTEGKCCEDEDREVMPLTCFTIKFRLRTLTMRSSLSYRYIAVGADLVLTGNEVVNGVPPWMQRVPL